MGEGAGSLGPLGTRSTVVTASPAQRKEGAGWVSAARPEGAGCGGGDAASALQPRGAAGLRGLPGLGRGYEVPQEWGSQRREWRHPADQRGKRVRPSPAMCPRPRHRLHWPRLATLCKGHPGPGPSGWLAPESGGQCRAPQRPLPRPLRALHPAAERAGLGWTPSQSRPRARAERGSRGAGPLAPTAPAHLPSGQASPGGWGRGSGGGGVVCWCCPCSCGLGL